MKRPTKPACGPLIYGAECTHTKMTRACVNQYAEEKFAATAAASAAVRQQPLWTVMFVDTLPGQFLMFNARPKRHSSKFGGPLPCCRLISRNNCHCSGDRTNNSSAEWLYSYNKRRLNHIRRLAWSSTWEVKWGRATILSWYLEVLKKKQWT